MFRFLENIQKLPDSQKKVIIWAITIIFGLILFGFWGYTVYKKVNSFDTDKAAMELNIPALKEKMSKVGNASGGEQDIINQPIEEQKNGE